LPSVSVSAYRDRDVGPLRQARELGRHREIVSATLGSGSVLEPLGILGAPSRNQPELIQVIELNRKVESELGHQFANHYGFPYPYALEATVRRHWQDFVGSTGAGAQWS
jgi:hypothetical protein